MSSPESTKDPLHAVLAARTKEYTTQFGKKLYIRKWSYGLALDFVPKSIGMVGGAVDLLMRGLTSDEIFKFANDPKIQPFIINNLSSLTVIVAETLRACKDNKFETSEDALTYLRGEEVDVDDIVAIVTIIYEQNLEKHVKKLQPVVEAAVPEKPAETPGEQASPKLT